MKKIGIGIMGLGVVGGGTYEIIRANREAIIASDGIAIEVKKVLELKAERMDKLNVPAAARTANLDDLLNDGEISIVVETMGGIEPAKSFILRAFAAGKSVVTANKELLAKHWAELEKAAKKNGVGLYFEASCVGGVPIIRALDLSMQANVIQQITGIINGTTNYILTKMTEDGSDYAAALKEAQNLGYAEANPAADVDGWDAVYKLSILSSIAFNTCVPLDRIYREGITRISAEDIAYAKEMGYRIKLLAIGKLNGKKVEAHVHPCLVPEEHPLAGVRNSYNAVYLTGDHVDDLMFYGKGAGAHPTGSAIVSDIVYCAGQKKHRYAFFKNDGKLDKGIKFVDDFASKYYINVTVLDKAGCLAKVAGVLGRCGVSLEQVLQKDAKGKDKAVVVYMTHESGEKAIARAVGIIDKLDVVERINNIIRVI
ncbi:MAG: homoserine dehydrogenase [Clostridiales bacterium]|jgi:homoserine dehydrogenase|nr:homoserine dehydrogenase [Clostridiales bacterium]